MMSTPVEVKLVESWKEDLLGSEITQPIQEGTVAIQEKHLEFLLNHFKEYSLFRSNMSLQRIIRDITDEMHRKTYRKDDTMDVIEALSIMEVVISANRIKQDIMHLFEPIEEELPETDIAQP